MQVIDGTTLGSGEKRKVTEAVKTLVKKLKPLLDERFALVHTLSVAGRREWVDALLMGPHGALVLKASDSGGRYRCLGDNWYVWDSKQKGFVDGRPNPIQELKQGLKMVEGQLISLGMGSTVPVQAGIIFVNAKLTLEHMEPVVSLIQANQISTLAGELMESPAYIEKRDIEKALAAFGAHVSVAATRQETATGGPTEGAPGRPGGRKARAWWRRRGPFGFKRWQLLVLALMFVACVCAIALSVYMVFF